MQGRNGNSLRPVGESDLSRQVLVGRASDLLRLSRSYVQCVKGLRKPKIAERANKMGHGRNGNDGQGLVEATIRGGTMAILFVSCGSSACVGL